MKIRHNDIVIDPNDPFGNCKLDRKKYAEVLTNIVGTYADGFVLAVNNEWGTGKTTFVKMWQQYLKNQQYKTIYFNAWENDFENAPLVALMSELNTLTEAKTKDTYKSLLKKGAVLSKNIFPALAKAIAAKYIDSKTLTDAIESTTKAATEILEDEVEDYAKKKEGLKDFKIKLEEYINVTDGNKPIVFIIDELDRCRPDYAVEVLEQIKHFFSVKGIVFVLSIDKIQLGNAVRGVYGSEHINADEYLRRFIDLEYIIPAPDSKLFCNYLFEYFQFDLFFEKESRMRLDNFREDKNLFISVASKVFKYARLTLRQQEKIFAHSRIVLNSFKENNYVFPGLLIMLVFIRLFHKDFYDKIKNKQLDLEELIEQFSKIIPQKEDNTTMNHLIQIEANLVFLYNNSLPHENRKQLIEKNDAGEETSTVKSSINFHVQNRFTQHLRVFKGNWSIDDTSLDYLTDKIDFTEYIIV